VASEAGRRHLWLWLSKPTARKAEFGFWQIAQGVAWPDNPVAMALGYKSSALKVGSKTKVHQARSAA